VDGGGPEEIKKEEQEIIVKSDNTTPFDAASYDQSVRETIPYYEVIHTEVVDLVRTLKPEVSVWLDTGCGTGYLIETALPFFPRTTFVLSDPSENMVKQAMNRLKISGKRIKFMPPMRTEDLLTLTDMPRPQVITAILCHHYLDKSQREKATEVCNRLLEKGGVFITVEHTAPFTEKGLETTIERWRRFQKTHGRQDIEEHLKRFNTRYFPITMNEHIELLKKTGFQIVEIFWFSLLDVGLYAIK